MSNLSDDGGSTPPDADHELTLHILLALPLPNEIMSLTVMSPVYERERVCVCVRERDSV